MYKYTLVFLGIAVGLFIARSNFDLSIPTKLERAGMPIEFSLSDLPYETPERYTSSIVDLEITPDGAVAAIDFSVFFLNLEGTSRRIDIPYTAEDLDYDHIFEAKIGNIEATSAGDIWWRTYGEVGLMSAAGDVIMQTEIGRIGDRLFAKSTDDTVWAAGKSLDGPWAARISKDGTVETVDFDEWRFNPRALEALEDGTALIAGCFTVSGPRTCRDSGVYRVSPEGVIGVKLFPEPNVRPLQYASLDDGRMWTAFPESGPNYPVPYVIGYNPETDGFETVLLDGDFSPELLSASPDGTLWVGEYEGRTARVTELGRYEILLNARGVPPGRLHAASSDVIWITEAFDGFKRVVAYRHDCTENEEAILICAGVLQP